jgi:mannonate dehydratase
VWKNYTYFIQALTPVAEEAGVRLALHPDDPPVRSLGGVARIFSSLDGLKRASEIASSPAWGMDLCLGTISEMGRAAAVMSAIDYFGPRGEVVYVHLRDVRGTVPNFEECFLGEGNYRPIQVLKRLMDVGFTGFILDDHTPQVVNDSSYGYRGRAHAIGYIQGLLETLDKDWHGL